MSAFSWSNMSPSLVEKELQQTNKTKEKNRENIDQNLNHTSQFMDWNWELVRFFNTPIKLKAYFCSKHGQWNKYAEVAWTIRTYPQYQINISAPQASGYYTQLIVSGNRNFCLFFNFQCSHPNRKACWNPVENDEGPSPKLLRLCFSQGKKLNIQKAKQHSSLLSHGNEATLQHGSTFYPASLIRKSLFQFTDRFIVLVFKPMVKWTWKKKGNKKHGLIREQNKINALQIESIALSHLRTKYSSQKNKWWWRV